MIAESVRLPFPPQLYLGFAGKRLLGDAAAVRHALSTRLDSLALALPGVQIVALGSGAEGSDQIFLELARERHWPFRMVLPFAPALFEQDFQANAVVLARFRSLCDSAAAIDVIPAVPTRRDGFTLCAESLVRQVDALFIVWDGKPGKHGGTSESILLARQCSRPCVLFSSETGKHFRDDLLDPEKLSGLHGEICRRNATGILGTLNLLAATDARGNGWDDNETPTERISRRLSTHGTPLGRAFRNRALAALMLHVAATLFGVLGLVYHSRLSHTAHLAFSALEFVLVASGVLLAVSLKRSHVHTRWVQARFVGEIRRSLCETANFPGDCDFMPRTMWELYSKLRLPLTTFFAREPRKRAGLRAFAENYLQVRIRGQLHYYTNKSAEARRAFRGIVTAFWFSTAAILAGSGLTLILNATHAGPLVGWGWELLQRFAPVFLPLVSAALLVLPNLRDLNRRHNSYDAVARKLRRLESEMERVLQDFSAGISIAPAGVATWFPPDPAESGDETSLAERFALNRVRTIVTEAERTMLTEVIEFASFCKNAEVG
jgi:hypothetical protein